MSKRGASNETPPKRQKGLIDPDRLLEQRKAVLERLIKEQGKESAPWLIILRREVDRQKKALRELKEDLQNDCPYEYTMCKFLIKYRGRIEKSLQALPEPNQWFSTTSQRDMALIDEWLEELELQFVLDNDWMLEFLRCRADPSSLERFMEQWRGRVTLSQTHADRDVLQALLDQLCDLPDQIVWQRREQFEKLLQLTELKCHPECPGFELGWLQRCLENKPLAWFHSYPSGFKKAKALLKEKGNAQQLVNEVNRLKLFGRRGAQLHCDIGDCKQCRVLRSLYLDCLSHPDDYRLAEVSAHEVSHPWDNLTDEKKALLQRLCESKSAELADDPMFQALSDILVDEYRRSKTQLHCLVAKCAICQRLYTARRTLEKNRVAEATDCDPSQLPGDPAPEISQPVPRDQPPADQSPEGDQSPEADQPPNADQSPVEEDSCQADESRQLPFNQPDAPVEEQSSDQDYASICLSQDQTVHSECSDSVCILEDYRPDPSRVLAHRVLNLLQGRRRERDVSLASLIKVMSAWEVIDLLQKGSVTAALEQLSKQDIRNSSVFYSHKRELQLVKWKGKLRIPIASIPAAVQLGLDSGLFGDDAVARAESLVRMCA